MQGKRIFSAAVLLLFLAAVSLASSDKRGKEEKMQAAAEADVVMDAKTMFEQVEIKIEGLKHSYRFVWVSDLHIITENDEIKEESLEAVRERKNGLFLTADGKTSARLWEELPEVINRCEADAVFFGGDMVDFASASNLEKLKEGYDKIRAPILYVRADHDYGRWHTSLSKEDVLELQAKTAEQKNINYLEYEDLCILGINKSTSNISDQMLKKIKKIFALGKPIILVMHVPVDSLTDSSLAEASRAARENRELIWGLKGTSYYEPDENTKEFLSMAYDENGPVREILCGHLHLTWDGKITDTVGGHVFSPAFSNSIGIINVHP